MSACSRRTLTPRVPLLATLTGLKTNQPNFVAAISTDGRSLTIVPASLLTADKRSMELWLIPEGGKPASLGLIAAGQPVQLNVPQNLLPLVGSGATLAVSLEPLGGSPTGQPTGGGHRPRQPLAAVTPARHSGRSSSSSALWFLLERAAPAAARFDVFSATAARMSAFNAFSSILSPSWISMARLHVAFEAGVEEA